LLLAEEVAEVRVQTLPPAGTVATLAHNIPGTVLFKNFAPRAFARLRQDLGVETAQYLDTLGGHFEFRSFSTTSKSGSFFFFSHDGQYMLKSMSNKEARVLQGMLAGYFAHMRDNPRSLLPRFLGMYSFAVGDGANAPRAGNAVHFVVMQSVFAGARELYRQFDLKGSQFSRTTVCPAGKDENLCTFKDMDFRRSHASAPDTFVSLSAGKKAQFLEQVKKDAGFLRDRGIMDYSLLLGISTEVRAGADTSRDAFVSADGKRVYYLGLIDVLQTWDFSKKAEKLLKTKLRGAAADSLSATPPIPYYDRFVEFMQNITEPQQLQPTP
jgi:hypothetical protein